MGCTCLLLRRRVIIPPLELLQQVFLQAVLQRLDLGFPFLLVVLVPDLNDLLRCPVFPKRFLVSTNTVTNKTQLQLDERVGVDVHIVAKFKRFVGRLAIRTENFASVALNNIHEGRYLHLVLTDRYQR